MTSPEYRRGVRPPNAGKRYPAEPLTPEEVRRVLGAVSNRGPSGIRNRAIVVALWRAGLRVGEALALRPKDLDLRGGTVAVLHGKGDRSRLVGIDPEAMATIERWIDVRHGLGIDGWSPLFCTIASNNFAHPVRAAYVRDFLKRAARKAGVEKRVHPHGFRHTHAFELAMEGVPLIVIQQQLGHSSLATTERYVRHVAPVAVIRAMQTRTWPEEVPAHADQLARAVG